MNSLSTNGWLPALLPILPMAVITTSSSSSFSVFSSSDSGLAAAEHIAAAFTSFGIDSVSLNPDSVVGTWLYLAGQEVGLESPER